MTDNKLVIMIQNFLEKYEYDALTWNGEILLHKGKAILDIQDFSCSRESQQWIDMVDIWDLSDKMHGLEEITIRRQNNE